MLNQFLNLNIKIMPRSDNSNRIVQTTTYILLFVMCVIRLENKKNVLVLVIGPVDIDAKKISGHKINTTPRKIPLFSSPVNHQHPHS